jgi:hypothetical protein
MDAQPIRPSRWWYGAATLIFVAGTALAVDWIARSIFWLDSGLQRVIIPGRGELTLQQPGDYQIYYEFRSVVGDRVFMTGEDVPELECHLGPKGSNGKVELDPVAVTTNYDLGSRAGKAILGFRIDQPGDYTLSASYPHGRSGPDIVLAVSRGRAANLLFAVLGGIATASAAFAIAVIIVIAAAMKRSKAKKLAQASQASSQTR